MRAVALIIASALGAASPAIGQDYPAGTTMLHGTIDNDSITVQCNLRTDGKMHCDFAQTMISRPADREDFESELPKKIDELLNSDELKSCGDMAGIAEAIRTGKTPKIVDDPKKFAEGLQKMKPQQKQDLLTQYDHLAAYCANPNRTTAEAALRAIRDKELRTCKVLTTTYSQNFVTSDFGKTWISNEGPAGECGVVYISKFEKAKDQDFFWVYFTQKVVTKKDAEVPLLSCSILDERQYFYDWKSDEKYLHCDYVEFGF